jgi:hypothetical protein
MKRVLLCPDGNSAREHRVSKDDLENMSSLFRRAGVDQAIIERLGSDSEEVMSKEECRSFSSRIKIVLSLRIVIMAEEVTIPGTNLRSVTPKLVSKTIDRPTRARCNSLADFLAVAAKGNGCFLRSEGIASKDGSVIIK